jgi:type IV pilus assembly protein PilM
MLAKRFTPIGVDIGSRSVKLAQLSADGARLVELARWDLPSETPTEPAARAEQVTDALRRAREGRKFHGRDAVISLGPRELFVQNVRLPKVPGEELEKLVRADAAERIPFPIDEAEIRFLEAADVRQGDQTRREVVLLACHRPVLDELLRVVEAAGLRPVAVDVEPAALLRCYTSQYRRDEDKQQRALFVHVGALSTAIVVAQESEALFIKYLDIGGQHFDEAVARNLGMPLDDAWALRRHNGDRRAEQQDPEVALGVMESVRPLYERLANEISLCLRYQSVTFRGQPVARLVLGGGEASQPLLDVFSTRLNLKCELGDPLRTWDQPRVSGRRSQWDVATGLALRGAN